MKKKIENKPKRNNKHWTTEEIEFLKIWYGRVKTDSLLQVFEKSAIAIWQQCKKHGIKLNPNIYSKTPVIATFQGKTYEFKAFQYLRNEQGTTKDMTAVRKKIGRPRKTTKDLPTEKQNLMAAHRRKPEHQEKKVNLKVNANQVQAFVAPAGKRLITLPGTKNQVYRTEEEIKQILGY